MSILRACFHGLFCCRSFFPGSAQDIPEHLAVSKKSPLPYELQPKMNVENVYQEIPEFWQLSELDNELEYRCSLDSTQQVLILYIDENTSLDGAQFLIKKGEQMYSQMEFQSIVDQFSKVWGKPTEEIGKYIWEMQLHSWQYYITLESLAPYQMPGVAMNYHLFEASK
jgi:hypothetical protein